MQVRAIELCSTKYIASKKRQEEKMTGYETVYNHKNFEMRKKAGKYYLKVKGDLQRAIRRYVERELHRGKKKLEELERWSRGQRKARRKVNGRVKPEHFGLPADEGKGGSLPSSGGPAFHHAQLNKIAER